MHRNDWWTLLHEGEYTFIAWIGISMKWKLPLLDCLLSKLVKRQPPPSLWSLCLRQSFTANWDKLRSRILRVLIRTCLTSLEIISLSFIQILTSIILIATESLNSALFNDYNCYSSLMLFSWISYVAPPKNPVRLAVLLILLSSPTVPLDPCRTAGQGACVLTTHLVPGHETLFPSSWHVCLLHPSESGWVPKNPETS